jgi:predicted dehydrogenase
VSQLRLGVVGYGNRGVIAQAAADGDGNAEVVAVAEPNAAGRKRAHAKFDIGGRVTLTDDVAGLIAAGVDAAFVTTPDFLHEEQVCELLEAGVPTFVDKPMAITLAGADRMLETAYRTGTRIYVGHNMRHNPGVRLMHRLVSEGAIGEVKAVWCRNFVGEGGERFFKDWHADRSKVDSLVLQKGSHDIDLIHWLAGGYTRRVVGMGGQTLYSGISDRADHSEQVVTQWFSKDHWPPLTMTGLNPVVDVEDLSMVSMMLDNGVYASYEECHYTPDYWRNYTVIGTEGRIENFGLEGSGVVRVWNRRSVYKPNGDIELPIPTAPGGHGGADPFLLAEFLEFVRTGEPTQTSPIAAREAVASAVLAAESMRDGATPRDVPAVSEHLVDYFARGQHR